MLIHLWLTVDALVYLHPLALASSIRERLSHPCWDAPAIVTSVAEAYRGFPSFSACREAGASALAALDEWLAADRRRPIAISSGVP